MQQVWQMTRRVLKETDIILKVVAHVATILTALVALLALM